MIRLYKTQYGAKFAREKMPRPQDWHILPAVGGYQLVYTGKPS